ncbi:MAG: hypothetical protein Q9174_000394 [Haloplaca sp. 1 TL-2023]
MTPGTSCFARHIIEVPIIRLFELAACHQYYAHEAEAIVGDACKVPAVQNELSTLIGWKFGFDAMYVNSFAFISFSTESPTHPSPRPGLLLAIYYGSLAGKYGRRAVLLLYTTGMLLSLGWVVFVCWLHDRVPVRLIWLSSLFILIGGGQKVARAMLFTLVADTVNTNHRTKYMSFLSSIPHITTLIAPPLSAIFMRISIWLPFQVALGALFLTYGLILVMPESSQLEILDDDETSTSARSTQSDNNDQRPLLSPEENIITETQAIIPDKESSNWYIEISHLLSIPGLRFCFIVFFVGPIALLAKAFVYQHASESFGWRMSTTTWLRVSQAVGASIVTLFGLPLLNILLHRQGIQARKLDLAVLRGSFLVAAAGFAILWQAQATWMLLLALFVCGLCESIQPANQGLATSQITREYNARLFTTVAVLETVGKLVGGPIQSALFSLGRKKEHPGSMGVNFLASSVIFLLLLLLALAVRVKR